MGKSGPDDAPDTRMIDRKVKQFDPESGAVKEVVHQVPEGIDPGWDYNVGTAAWGENEAKRMAEAGGKWEEIDTWLPKAYPDRPAKIPIETTTIKPGPPAATEEHLRKLLRQTIGGDSAAYTDPRGDVVMITQALIDHYLEKTARLKAHREEFFPFLPDLIRNPFEIWVTFERNDVSGRIRAVKRYVKAIRTDGTHIVGLVADVRKGYALNVTFYQGGLTGVKGLRKGRLLYGRN
ncbi:MAG TPA: PBECR2 nuclease fold domain-containing protein, partial [Deltaproteobacteria bacterium]|nr:PBECR2 nuclease fold domain-containing protein [Deltaproteobacteria bacterium]